MLSNDQLREWPLSQMEKSLRIVRHILDSAEPEALVTLRDGGDGWTVLEVLCHLRDYEALFIERAKMTISIDLADLPNPDPDKVAEERQYSEQNLQEAYTVWANNREHFLNYLTTLSEADWQRAAKHPRRGLMTVQDQLFLTAWHDVNHIEQMVKILDGR